ncbi:hypothetical protein A2U01_0044132 [Trifolium medium]|uniref:Uncharacterized protein n=1 Tax=Trifolium medium TaxID=97028 RepID=A0A392QGG5_9FABA|nr:hypothetical protein [Trifolium medium]
MDVVIQVSNFKSSLPIFKYIRGAPGKGLIDEDRGHTRIVGYSDADWAGSPIDRRSTSE